MEKTQTESPKKKSSWNKEISFGNVSQKQILFFTKNLSTLLRSGSTLPESLAVLKEQSKGKLQKILSDASRQIDGGNTLSATLRKYPKVFSEIYTNMLQIGEESGKLDQNLEHLSLQLEKSYSLRKKIISAMIYPSIVLVGGVLLSIGIAIFILPKVARIFKNFHTELPLATRILLRISEFFQNNGPLAITLFIGITVFLFWILRQRFTRPVTHWIILHLPVVKQISQHLNLAVICRNMSLLLKSGTTIDESIKICAKSLSNIYYQRFLLSAHGKIKGGDSLTNVLHANKNLFPPTDVQIISVGEASGNLSNSLEYCSSLHEAEVDDLTKNLATILEPILLITIGLMVGFLALSIITPIYSITGQLRK